MATASNIASAHRWCCRRGRIASAGTRATRPGERPAWPDDPDVKRAKQRKEAGQEVRPRARRRRAPGAAERIWPPQRADTTGWRRHRQKSAEESACPEHRQGAWQQEHLQLGCSAGGGSRPSEEYDQFSGEPRRGALTEPPARLPHAFTQPALRRRQREVEAAESRIAAVADYSIRSGRLIGPSAETDTPPIAAGMRPCRRTSNEEEHIAPPPHFHRRRSCASALSLLTGRADAVVRHQRLAFQARQRARSRGDPGPPRAGGHPYGLVPGRIRR